MVGGGLFVYLFLDERGDLYNNPEAQKVECRGVYIYFFCGGGPAGWGNTGF